MKARPRRVWGRDGASGMPWGAGRDRIWIESVYGWLTFTSRFVIILTRLDLHVLRDEFAIANVVGDDSVLRLEAESGFALFRGGNPAIANEFASFRPRYRSPNERYAVL